MRKCWQYLITATALISCTAACNTGGAPDPLGPDASVAPPCTDVDGDGFGLGCGAGVDCDDTDPLSTNECRGCSAPDTGCACDDSVTELPCYLDPVDVDGSAMCLQGTRFCRDKAWTACLELSAFRLPGTLNGGTAAALVTGPVACNPCNPSCYSTTDTPGPADVGTGGVVYTPAPGGLTLPATIGAVGLTDTDGDGVPDIYDSEPANPAVTGFEGGFFHVLPSGATALDPLVLSVRVRTADIYFLMDTTGSMGGEIDNLKATLTTTVIPAITTAIPDAWFGVGRHDDYPVASYGDPGYGDRPFQHLLDITNSTANITAAVNSLGTRNGSDWPEAQTQALWSVASGAALGPFTTAHSCAAGFFGYPCFRPGTVPIVVLLTDAPYHNGPYSGYNYTTSDFGGTFYSYFPMPATVAVTGTPYLAPASAAVPAATTGGGFRALPATVAAGGTPDTWISAHPIGDVTSMSASYSGDTSAAGINSNYDTSCASTNGAKDVVFSFSLTATTRLKIDSSGSGFKNIVSVWSSTGPTEIAGLCNNSGGNTSQLDTTLAAGTYYIVLDGRKTGNSGSYVLNLAPYVPGVATNETYATAQAIGELTTRANGATITGDTCAMVNHYSGTCASGSAGDAVFSFTLAASTHVVLDTVGSGFNTSLSLWSGAVPTYVDCNDDAVGTQSRIDTTLPAGTYYAVVDGNGAACGAYTFSVTPYLYGGPTNETYATAYAVGDVTSRSASFSGDTSVMTSNYTGTCNSGAGGDAVFMFTLTAARHVVIDTGGSAFDTSLSLWSGAAPTYVICNDDSIGRQSRIERDLGIGTYYAVVDGFATSEGPYILNLQVSSGTGSGFTPPTYTQTLSELNSRGIKVIVVESSDGYDRARSDADALCTATGTVSSTGTPLRYSISSSGAGLGATIATAISDLANYSRMDIIGRANDNPATVGFDERTFVASIAALSYPAGRCTGITGGVQFNQCLPGTTVNFQVNFTGVVAATSVAQRFDFTIDVLGNGSTILSTVPVTIIIPPIAPAYPVSGTYSRDFDATTSCTGTEVARWRGLSWSATYPVGTSISWAAAGAATAAGLATATSVSFSSPTLPSPQDIGDRLIAAGLPATLPFLRVTATLNSNAARSAAPTLSSFNMVFDCIPGV